MCSSASSTDRSSSRDSAFRPAWLSIHNCRSQTLTFQPLAIEEPAQHQYRLPVATQCPPTASSTSATALGGQQAGNEQHGGLPDREHGGETDRIGHSRTSVRLDICGRTSLLPRSCAPSGHLAALGVSPTCRPSATGNGSLGGVGGGEHRSALAVESLQGLNPLVCLCNPTRR